MIMALRLTVSKIRGQMSERSGHTEMTITDQILMNILTITFCLTLNPRSRSLEVKR